MQFFSVDGAAVWKLGDGEVDSAHVDEQSMGVRPFLSVAQFLVLSRCLKDDLSLGFPVGGMAAQVLGIEMYLYASSCATKLAKRDAKQKGRSEETNHSEAGLVVENMIPLILE